MTTTKMTREQKAAEANARTEAEYMKAAWTRVQSELVLEGDGWDGALTEKLGERIGREQAFAVIRLVRNAIELRKEAKKLIEWVRKQADEALSHFEQNSFYSSTPLHSADEANRAFVLFHTSARAAYETARAFGVHVVAFETAESEETRAKIKSLSVVHFGGGLWVVMRDNEPVKELHEYEGNPSMDGFAEEWMAWAAVHTLVHGKRV